MHMWSCFFPDNYFKEIFFPLLYAILAEKWIKVIKATFDFFFLMNTESFFYIVFDNILFIKIMLLVLQAQE